MEREIIIGRKKIGEAIKIERNRRNLTQGQLADLCDLDQPMISRMEQGSDNVSEKKLRHVCGLLSLGEITTALEKKTASQDDDPEY